MAVMTSQQADGVAGLPEKPVVIMATEASSTTTPDAPVAEAPKSDAAAAPATADAVAAPTPDAPVKDVANGDQKETEVNGHDEEVSPKTLVPETKTDSLPTPEDEPLEEAQATPAKKEEDASKAEESKEGEAKSDEKAQKEEEKPAPVEDEKKAEEPARAEEPKKAEESAKSEEKKVEGNKMEIDAPEPPAGDVPKESIASPAEDKAPEPAAEEKSKEEKPAAAEEAKEQKPAEPKADVATEAKADEAKEQKAEEAKDVAPAPPAIETPTTEPAPKPHASPVKQQEDVEMTDAPATVEEPAKTEESKPAEATPTATQQETQDTTVSDVPPPTPAGEEAKKDKDAPRPSPAAPVTADTSMSDAPPSSAKPYREREEDSEDEPVAKRAKVSPAADQANAKSEAKREDKMDVDSKPVASSASTPAPTRNEPKSLADDSINHLPISDYMNRQIRMVLAGVKKTKAGYHFRLPVSELWPGLWNEYSAKVKDPVDIQTMERRLRGTLTKYQTLGDFKRDLDKLVQNSITFNGEFHDVTGAARSCRDTILSRLGTCPAFEPSRPEKKDVAKQHTTRHAEPRSATHHSSPPAHLPQRPQQPRVNTAAVPTPSSSKPIESPAFAIPANNNGMPLIRRDSTKPDSRAKRPVKPTHSKDLVYDTKRKKKLSPELRFCEEVLTELRKQRYYEFNEAFQKPVDPVALNIPTYHKIIKKPMDLSTMQSKLNAGDYANSKEFERDFDLIIKNCRLFNGEQHIVYDQALRLQSLYRREMSKKDEWLAKHAPPAAHHSSNTSPRMKDESDWDEPESEGEPEVDEELKGAQQRLASYMKRLEEEQKKINDIMLEMNPNMADVEIAQSVVAMLQKQIITERSKIASMQPTKKAAPAKSHHAKPAASKPKKAMPSGGSSSHHAGGGNVAKKAGGGHSSMSGGHGGGMGGMPKKAAARKPAPKRKMGTVEKEVIAAGIAELEGSQLERAIQIIKDDTGTGENDSGELELDIDQLSQEALTQLYDLAIKAFPHLQREKERTMAAQAVPPPPPAAQRSKPVQKTKKNKPMSKMEQERRLQQLNELRAQAGRQGSGSQEPMESIEGTGRASVDPAPQHHREEDSEDEESSEEE